MKKLSLLLLLLTLWVNAQNQRFTYEYKFTNDVSRLDSLFSERMALDVSDKGSVFYSYDVKVRDSIINADFEKQISLGSTNIVVGASFSGHGGRIRHRVLKKYPEFKTELIDSFGGNTYKVDDKRKLDWKMTSETQKIGDWNCQKATVSFAGREWEAWFTTEIPIPDGPYKFHGLPGLIVKISNEDQSHIYQLIGIKNLSTEEIESAQNGTAFEDSEIKILTVSQKQYAKQKENYLKDPTAEFRRMFSEEGTTIKIKGKDGRERTGNDLLREMEKRNRERPRNPIEKELLK